MVAGKYPGSPSGTRYPAVFLDRDGVIVVPEFRAGRSYAPRRLEDLTFYPEAADSVRALRAAGYRVVVVTNQPDVGNGLSEKAVVKAMHERLMTAMPVDAIKCCYDSQRTAGEFRKPRSGMLLEAAVELGLDLSASYMVGDRWSDVEAGRAAGCMTIFVDHGYRERQPDRPDAVVCSLAEAASVILSRRLTAGDPADRRDATMV